MGDVNVLVVFYSRHGRTEKIALAAGVGAIQARGNIRLRRVADRADQQIIDGDAAWKETLERMKADYVEPRPIDAEWADLIVIATPPDRTDEIFGYLDQLRDAVLPAGKTAAPIVSGDGARVIQKLCAACASAGLAVTDASPVPSEIAAAREYGRLAVDAVRSRRPERANVPSQAR
jgi:hypothetical protein